MMSVYQHYRYRSYVRDMLAQTESPWSYLDDDDKWLKKELKTKARGSLLGVREEAPVFAIIAG
jgi:hypothetical protein